MDEVHPRLDAIPATENDSNNKNHTQILIPETEGGKGAKSCRNWGNWWGCWMKFQEQELPPSRGSSSEQPQQEFVRKVPSAISQTLPLY